VEVGVQNRLKQVVEEGEEVEMTELVEHHL
jgi:hypothetical protein